MKKGYEYLDTTYYELLPRILLVNFKQKDIDALKKSDFNFKVPKYDILPNLIESLKVQVPCRSDDIDLIFVNASDDKYEFRRVVIKDESIAHVNLIASDWTEPIIKKGGCLIFFIGRNSGGFIKSFVSGFSIDESFKLKVNETPYKVKDYENDEKLIANFIISNHKNASIYYHIFDNRYVERPNFFREVVKDSVGRTYAGFSKPSKTLRYLFLPIYSNIPKIIIDLLEKVLPKTNAKVFPFAKDFGWLEDESFKPKEVITLLKKKETINKRYNKEIETIDKKIEDTERANKFLIDILTTKGDELKRNVKITIEGILKMIGSKLEVIDVDKDDDMKDIDRRKKDDLRIKYNESNIILIEVKGSESIIKQGELNQLVKHRRIFMKYHNDYTFEDITPLLINNHDYGQGTDPRNRQSLFHPNTKDAIDRMNADNLSAMQTYDLFRLYKDIKDKKVKIKERDFISFLTIKELMDYDSFVKEKTHGT